MSVVAPVPDREGSYINEGRNHGQNGMTMRGGHRGYAGSSRGTVVVGTDPRCQRAPWLVRLDLAVTSEG